MADAYILYNMQGAAVPVSRVLTLYNVMHLRF